jgi:uncharacterized protein (DUF2267 family)
MSGSPSGAASRYTNATYHALRAVLHALRDRLTVDEAAHLGDELPMLVRGIYLEGCHPSGRPEKVCSRDEFQQRINAHLHIESIGAEDAARAIFKVLVHHLAPGVIRHVVSELPQDILTLLARTGVSFRLRKVNRLAPGVANWTSSGMRDGTL